MKICRLLVCVVLWGCFVVAWKANAQDVEYQLTFEGRWNSSLPQPPSAHFTAIVGATHLDSVSIFEPGQLASLGVEQVAELGFTPMLENEINTMIGAGTVDALILGTNGFIGPEQTETLSFFANASHTHISLMTMIAPSPDWFVGIDSLDLTDGSGNWHDKIVVDAFSYDAGTEEGDGLSLNNPATMPQDVIQLLDVAEPNNPFFGAGSIGRFTFTRVSAVPEPTSGSLLIAVGLTACLHRRRRSKSRRHVSSD